MREVSKRRNEEKEHRDTPKRHRGAQDERRYVLHISK